MADDRAVAVPLVEQLRSVPRDAVLRIDTPNALGCMDTRSIPVGRMCHEAADALGVDVPAPLSDERILHLWDAHVAYETGASVKQQPLGDKDKIAFARAVLAAGVKGTSGGEQQADELFEAIEYAVLAKANGRDRGTLLAACKAKLRDVMIDAERHRERESHVPPGSKLVPERFWINFCEFVSDWKKGDFDLPELARLDVQACLGALDTSGVAPTGEGEPSEDYKQGWMDGANEAAHLLATDDSGVPEGYASARNFPGADDVAGVAEVRHQTEAPADADDAGIGHE